ncbi:ankyrin repeat-containing protein [Rubidibacter lacunae KORDI 51-2]|uniref:Ankyrin repeat-containing protein n=1 Tax=Rubidibacter lacunae KORDI 51-2 TaxID=582515 RepID=U5DJG8_9CHRO|nr:ankyrin repeat domain-containing protein [Rubidibacter lacunae]ERN41067.1 ankyrin repeat-containing protein [Rubidibacter lacunae KORDI 51-2]
MLSIRTVDPVGDPPLLLAVLQGHVGVVETLLAASADANASNERETSLGSAIARGQTELVRILLAAGANPNTHMPKGMTGFMRACDGNDAAVVQLLLEPKPN